MKKKQEEKEQKNPYHKEYRVHEELMNLPGGIYATMFEAQAQYYR